MCIPYRPPHAMQTRLSRRSALKLAALAGATPLLPPAFPVRAEPASGVSPRRLRLLVLGGTRFVGPALVRAALARGHEVTLFNRGVTRPWLFPGLERRHGNRYPEIGEGLASLGTGEWDAAIDLPAYFPRIVDASTSLLRGRVGQYVVMSSISVYADFTRPSIDESAAVRTLERDYEERLDLSEDYDWGSYGARKALCEQFARDRFPDGWLAVRACGIAGGGLSDPSKWYWPARLNRDTVLAAPGDGLDPVQIIDRRDIADFIVRAVERKLTGVYNVAGAPMPFDALLETTRRVVGGRARVVWVGDEHRRRLGSINAPAPRRQVPGFAGIDTSRARAHGFLTRPIKRTLAADWLWFREHHRPDFDFHAAGHGPDPVEERRLLDELRS